MCGHCSGRGLEPITGCPKEQVTPDVYLVRQTMEDLENGAGWPEGRGWLDESHVLVHAVRYAKPLNDMAKSRYIRAKRI